MFQLKTYAHRLLQPRLTMSLCLSTVLAAFTGLVLAVPADAMPVPQMLRSIANSENARSAILIREDFCSGDECICLDCSDEAPREEHVYASPPAGETEPPYHEEPQAPPPCQKDRYVERRHVYRPSEPSYDVTCGIRCWYWRLRKGYCGRGCEYYQFRMYDYPYGPLGKGAYSDCRY